MRILKEALSVHAGEAAPPRRCRRCPAKKDAFTCISKGLEEKRAKQQSSFVRTTTFLCFTTETRTYFLSLFLAFSLPPFLFILLILKALLSCRRACLTHHFPCLFTHTRGACLQRAFASLGVWCVLAFCTCLFFVFSLGRLGAYLAGVFHALLILISHTRTPHRVWEGPTTFLVVACIL